LSNLGTDKGWPWKYFSVLFFLIKIVIILIFFSFLSELIKCPEFEYPSDVRDIVILPGQADDIQFGKCPCYHLNRSIIYLFIYRPVVQPSSGGRGLLGGLAGLLLCLLCLATLGLLGLFAAFVAVTAYLGKILQNIRMKFLMNVVLNFL